MADLRDLPSVDYLLNLPACADLLVEYGHALTVEAIRAVLHTARQKFAAGETIPPEADLVNQVAVQLHSWTTPTLLPVINATGVILHTNLGRAPLSQAALNAVQQIAMGYSNLEYDLTRGRRGSRLSHSETILHRLTGAEAAVVVNNNAAAVLLALSALTRRRAVVIARSQLVEIGGGFRVPDVMKQSGARLLEVGTTNRVNLHDYEGALEEKPALFMRAHRSNFRIIGFTAEPEFRDIVSVAHQASIPVLDDLGSGSLLDTASYGLGHEPTIQESLAAGADLVCFSGDKLLGGPQAGIIVGQRELVEKIKRHPLARAVRADKMALAALNATLLHYLKGEAEREIPVWRMVTAQINELQQRAQNWVATLGKGQVVGAQSTVGGGSLPGETLPTFILSLQVPSPNRILDQLRRNSPPVIGRIDGDRMAFDPRTVLPEQDPLLLAALQVVLG